MSIGELEKKVAMLQRVVNAQHHGSNGVFLTTDERGKTSEGREQVLTEKMAEKGLQRHDLEAAGIPVRHANLTFLGGRRMGITTKEQADAFLAGTWRPYSDEEPIAPTSTAGIEK